MSELSELEQFSALIGDIYDAALEPSLWCSVLQKICAFVPGSYATIFVQDATGLGANALFTWGIDEYFFQSYLEVYSKINPLFPITLFQDVGRVFTMLEVLPQLRYENTRFYKEWVEPQGLLDSMASILEKSSTSCSMLAVNALERSGPVTEPMRGRMRLIVPHVQRAVAIGKLIDLKSVVLETFSETFDSLSAAVYFVNSNGSIVHANRSGLVLRSQDTAFRAKGGLLETGDRPIDRLLREIFQAAAVDDVGAKGATIPLMTADGDRYVAHLLPLSIANRRRLSSRAVAAVFVHKTGLQSLTLVEAVAKHFQLTPGELRVLFAIIEVGGVPEVAPVLGVSESTVKTHLKRVFAKTGTSRQADLVRLVAELANPLTH